MATIRQFVTCNASGKRVDPNDDCNTVMVAELGIGMGAVDVDGDDVECSERDAIRTVTTDAVVPLFCCRGPRRKLPPQSPEEALRQAASRGREGLKTGDVVLLNGKELAI